VPLPGAVGIASLVAKPKHPTRAMLAAIGRVAAESAVVEDRLRELLCQLLGTELGRAIAAGDDVAALVLHCQRVVRYSRNLTDEQVEELAEIFRAIETLRPHRNFLIHAQWERARQPGEHLGLRSSRVAPRSMGKQASEVVKWHVDDAEWVADAFLMVSKAIRKFIDDNFEHGLLPLIERETWAKFNAVADRLAASMTRPQDAAPVEPPERSAELGGLQASTAEPPSR